MAVDSGYTKDTLKRYATGMAGLIALFSLYAPLINVIGNITQLPAIISVPLVSVLFGLGAFFFTLEVFL